MELWNCGNAELGYCGAAELWNCGNAELGYWGTAEWWNCGIVELLIYVVVRSIGATYL